VVKSTLFFLVLSVRSGCGFLGFEVLSILIKKIKTSIEPCRICLTASILRSSTFNGSAPQTLIDHHKRFKLVVPVLSKRFSVWCCHLFYRSHSCCTINHPRRQFCVAAIVYMSGLQKSKRFQTKNFFRLMCQSVDNIYQWIGREEKQMLFFISFLGQRTNRTLSAPHHKRMGKM